MVELNKGNRKLDEGFKIQSFVNQPDQIILDEIVVDDVEESWGYCLVGYVACRFPGKSALFKMSNAWKVEYHYFCTKVGSQF